MSKKYRLPDEPQPSGFAHLVVEPSAPLLAVMFAGCGLAWPWMVFNAWALGSPTRVRETWLVVLGFVGNFVIAIAVTKFSRAFALEEALAYLFTLLLLWKLGISYLIVTLQSASIEVYRYYGGTVNNGLMVAIVAGHFLRRIVERWMDGLGSFRSLLEWVLL